MSETQDLCRDTRGHKSAKDFLDCVGEELKRADAVLNKLKRSNDVKTGTEAIPAARNPYEFLAQLEKERMQRSRRPREAAPLAAFAPQINRAVAPTLAPIQEIEVHDEPEPVLLCKDCRRVGVRLLKVPSSSLEPPLAKLKHSLLTARSDAKLKPLTAQNSTTNTQKPLPSTTLASTLEKLREMGTAVAELQSNLNNSLKTKKQKERKHLHPNAETNLKFARFVDQLDD